MPHDTFYQHGGVGNHLNIPNGPLEYLYVCPTNYAQSPIICSPRSLHHSFLFYRWGLLLMYYTYVSQMIVRSIWSNSDVSQQFYLFSNHEVQCWTTYRFQYHNYVSVYYYFHTYVPMTPWTVPMGVQSTYPHIPAHVPVWGLVRMVVHGLGLSCL